MSEREQFAKQVDRLTNSSVLHTSESLCKLLRYLAAHALEQPGVPVKEYQIATEVFGRRTDFDPQVDSTIRVQTGRLRNKLAEYYSSEGTQDALVVELPRGSYALQFHHRVPGNGKAAALPDRLDSDKGYSHTVSRNWKVAALVLASLLAAAAVMIVELSNSRKVMETALAGENEPVPTDFQVFWKPFLTGGEETWLVFSNAAFVGRPETGMRYYNPARDGTSVLRDHYTGVGEVLAVHELDQVFAVLHQRIRVKRGSLFSLDDVRNNNLIFLGSPSENLTLTEIPNTREFVFQRLSQGQRKGDLAIVNVHPKPGEANFSLASPSDLPLTEDYAVISLALDTNPPHSVMILAGTTTFGTQAAVEYVCRENSLKTLLAQTPRSKNGEIMPFEALLHTKVTRGVPVQTDLVAVRPRPL